MKSLKAAILGSLVGGSLLLLSVPSQAAPWGRFNHGFLGNDIRNDGAEIRNDRRDLFSDHRDLANDRRELHQDLRDGASSAEIANDRQDIRKDRSDIANDRRGLHEERSDLNHDLARDHSFFGWWDRR